MSSHQAILYGFPQCYRLLLLHLRFHGAGKVKECQGSMKHFQPEARQASERCTGDEVSISTPSMSESWRVFSLS